MLARKFRISRQKDFDYIFKNGRTYRGNYIVAKIAPNINDIPRFAVVVSKKISTKAIVRNLAKRRIKAMLIKLMPRLLAPSNVVVIVKKFPKDDSISLQRDVEEVLVGARIFRKNV
jgi:ribonuclease P protein component